MVVERLVKKSESVRRSASDRIYGRKNEKITVDGNVNVKNEIVIKINDIVNFRLWRWSNLDGEFLFVRLKADAEKVCKARKLRRQWRGMEVVAVAANKTKRL